MKMGNGSDGSNQSSDNDEDATLRLVATTNEALELMENLADQEGRFRGAPGDLFDQMDQMRQRLQGAWNDVLGDEDTNSNGEDGVRNSSGNRKDGYSNRNPRGSNGGRGDSGHLPQSTKTKDDDGYHSSYVQTMTEVLEEPLDAMRQQYEQDLSNAQKGEKRGNNPSGLEMDIDLLVDALQSGIDLLLPEERQLFLEELQAMEKEEDESKGEPIHNIRRRELGYDA